MSADGLPLRGTPPLFTGLDWKVEKGSRVLLIGANGAGTTTVMKIMAGKHMVEREQCKILGESPFHATDLTSSGRLSYIGGTWQRDIAFAGYNIPLQGDFSALKMIEGIQGVDKARRERLVKVLDIDPAWRMHTVSEGQRRRVQLCIGLLKEFEVLFLDEVTVDLDVLGRADLMNFLREECEQRECTIIYVSVPLPLSLSLSPLPVSPLFFIFFFFCCCWTPLTLSRSRLGVHHRRRTSLTAWRRGPPISPSLRTGR